MNLNGDRPKSSPIPAIPVVAPLAMGMQVGCITLVIVFLALFGGLAIDKTLDSKPIFTFLLLLGSAPLALFVTFKLAMRTAKNMQKTMPSPPSSVGRAKISDEEDLSE